MSSNLHECKYNKFKFNWTELGPAQPQLVFSSNFNSIFLFSSDQRDSRSRPFSWSRSRSRKYTFSWSLSQSRIFVNKSLGLACWDWTCSVLVWNLKIWSRRSQNPFLGKSTILSYGFALRFQVWSKLYIEATEGSARVSVSTIFLVSVSVLELHIFLVLVSV